MGVAAEVGILVTPLSRVLDSTCADRHMQGPSDSRTTQHMLLGACGDATHLKPLRNSASINRRQPCTKAALLCLRHGDAWVGSTGSFGNLLKSLHERASGYIFQCNFRAAAVRKGELDGPCCVPYMDLYVCPSFCLGELGIFGDACTDEHQVPRRRTEHL